jgi:L-fuculokinase
MIGSGTSENEMVLSSGTWEILMTRTRNVDLSNEALQAGLTNEFDAISGLYNTGIQWLGSGVLEWIKGMFYSTEVEHNQDVYRIMIEEASKTNQHNINFSPDFINESGVISGIGMHTTREQIYLAALNSLVEKTKAGLDMLQNTGKFKANSLIVVGGGSKNKLWNRLRANKLGIPVKIARQTETTVLGASIFAHKAVGNFESIEQGIDYICKKYDIIEPD